MSACYHSAARSSILSRPENARRLSRVPTRPPDDDRESILNLLNQIAATRRATTPPETARLRQSFALDVLPAQPTTRVREKHAQHVEDDIQWPADVSPEDYLESLRDAVRSPRGGIYLAEGALDRTWTIYFVSPVPYRSRGRYPGRRIVVLFNLERLFWITGFQAEDGDSYVNRRPGFWVYHPRQ
jgi:hypothetical protein